MVRFWLTLAISAATLIFLAMTSWAAPAEMTRTRSSYFPPGVLRADPAADAEYVAWYTSMLRRMRMPEAPAEPAQPSLFELTRQMPKHPEEFRALVGRGRDYLMAVRAYVDSSGAHVVANEVDLRASGGTRSIERRLTNDQWGAILHQLPKAGIFRSPHVPARFAGDCQDWVFEEREGAQYNVLSVSCPKDPEVLKLGQAFLNAAGWAAD